MEGDRTNATDATSVRARNRRINRWVYVVGFSIGISGLYLSKYFFVGFVALAIMGTIAKSRIKCPRCNKRPSAIDFALRKCRACGLPHREVG